MLWKFSPRNEPLHLLEQLQRLRSTHPAQGGHEAFGLDTDGVGISLMTEGEANIEP